MFKYTIIIAVYKRLQEVKELLETAELLKFDREKFEILFVDDGSNDGLVAFLEQYDSYSSLNIRFIVQENKGPGEARNNGMRNSTSDYFIFNDSDLLYPSNYLEELDKGVVENNFDAFGGPDDCHPSFSPLLKAINYSMTSFIGTGGTRGSKKSVTKFYPRSFNFGLKKEVFETIGGMNQLRHGQDMDFSARIYEAGYKVGLIPDAIVFHKRRTSLKRFFKQIFNWGVARINLNRLHPSMSKPIHFAPAFIVFVSILLLLLSLFSPIARIFTQIGILALFALLVFAFFQSLSMYKSIKVSFLSMVTLFIQVYAYGLGTLTGLIKSIGQKGVIKGFTKDYYK